MILAYGIVTVLAVIVGSVAGHTLTKYFEAFDESVDENIKEISEKQKGNEILREKNEKK
jgi:hypothetical protein